MKADNSSYLQAAADARSEKTRQRAVEALAELERQNVLITITSLAKAAGVARSWIYTQSDLVDRINNQPRPKQESAHKSRASEESWQNRLAAAHQRIKELSDENKQLRAQLAVAYGQRRADQQHSSKTPSATQISRS